MTTQGGRSGNRLSVSADGALRPLHVMFIRRAELPDEALQRLQATPLRLGLSVQGARVSTLDLSAVPRQLPRATHLVVHHNDVQAIRAAAKLREKMGARVVCLCSDVYRYERYRQLDAVADLFLAPTRMHCEVIRSVVSHPVELLPEGIDPIALPEGGPVRPVQPSNRVCWFGYPESFDKSMRFLLPEALTVAGFDTAHLGIITAPDKELLPGAVHLPFSATSFYQQTEVYSHALLSHFAYDLHVNTLMKSANKMITAIVRGMVPLVSATPSYLELAARYGLEELCFRNAGELSQQLRKLDFARDADRFHLAAVRKELLAQHAPGVMARRFLDLIA